MSNKTKPTPKQVAEQVRQLLNSDAGQVLDELEPEAVHHLEVFAYRAEVGWFDDDDAEVAR